MNKLYLPKYNLKQTLLGGQSFSWDWDDKYKSYFGFTQDEVIVIKPQDDHILWQTYPEPDNEYFIKEYLVVDNDYEQKIQMIKSDKNVANAIAQYPDIRILRQPTEQTILSYILSAQKNIPAIRKSVRFLSKELGQPIETEAKTVHLFPTSRSLANAPDSLLLQSKIGFRAKYLKSAAHIFSTTNFIPEFKSLNEDDAREKLKSLYGVGDKIADCVLLYALGFENVVPLDVWMQKILHHVYGLDQNLSYDKMRDWTKTNFNNLAGVAGQFLFEYYRNNPHLIA